MTYKEVSPNGHLSATVVAGKTLSYSVARDGFSLIEPSEISMTLSDGIVFGENEKVRKEKKTSQGGISNYVPTEANRHTKVMLYMK